MLSAAALFLWLVLRQRAMDKMLVIREEKLLRDKKGVPQQLRWLKSRQT
jgi:hypothetical protein